MGVGHTPPFRRAFRGVLSGGFPAPSDRSPQAIPETLSSRCFPWTLWSLPVHLLYLRTSAGIKRSLGVSPEPSDVANVSLARQMNLVVSGGLPWAVRQSFRTDLQKQKPGPACKSLRRRSSGMPFRGFPAGFKKDCFPAGFRGVSGGFAAPSK